MTPEKLHALLEDVQTQVERTVRRQSIESKKVDVIDVGTAKHIMKGMDDNQ